MTGAGLSSAALRVTPTTSNDSVSTGTYFVGRWRRRKAAADSGCDVGETLAVFGAVGRQDLVKLLSIYDEDMNRFGYTWSETTLTARCGAKTGGRSPADNATTQRYCC